MGKLFTRLCGTRLHLTEVTSGGPPGIPRGLRQVCNDLICICSLHHHFADFGNLTEAIQSLSIHEGCGTHIVFFFSKSTVTHCASYRTFGKHYGLCHLERVRMLVPHLIGLTWLDNCNNLPRQYGHRVVLLFHYTWAISCVS